MNLEKITRCTTGEAVMADHISKAEFHECFRAGRRMDLVMAAAPAAIPEALLKWVCLPYQDDTLRDRLLPHLAREGLPVLGGYSDWILLCCKKHY